MSTVSFPPRLGYHGLSPFLFVVARIRSPSEASTAIEEFGVQEIPDFRALQGDVLFPIVIIALSDYLIGQEQHLAVPDIQDPPPMLAEDQYASDAHLAGPPSRRMRRGRIRSPGCYSGIDSTALVKSI